MKKRALMCVFSGTKNTWRVGDRLIDELLAYGYDTDIYSISTHGLPVHIDCFDMLIVGYPVHAFNAPKAFLEFLKKLPYGEGRKAYIIRTSGEPLKFNDASGIVPRRILKKRGYNVLGEFSYVMPYNIIFRHSDEMAARMWQCAENRIKRDAALIGAGAKIKTKVNPLRRAVSFTLRIEHIAMPLLGRRFKVDKAKCVGCNVCSSKCPQSNIELVDCVPKFGKKCVGCMACAFHCPMDAIRTSVLNGWRVNGKYSFDGTPATDDEVCKFCNKAYLRYFHESEQLYEKD
ncbi:MAG: EFR1 family ferrodoxin [Clostridiales bacterium]|nr:EFR1 family ferrodoxin [Clostridiales bacterium]